MVRGCFPGSGRAVCSSFFSCLLLAHICPPLFRDAVIMPPALSGAFLWWLKHAPILPRVALLGFGVSFYVLNTTKQNKGISGRNTGIYFYVFLLWSVCQTVLVFLTSEWTNKHRFCIYKNIIKGVAPLPPASYLLAYGSGRRFAVFAVACSWCCPPLVVCSRGVRGCPLKHRRFCIYKLPCLLSTSDKLFLHFVRTQKRCLLIHGTLQIKSKKCKAPAAYARRFTVNACCVAALFAPISAGLFYCITHNVVVWVFGCSYSACGRR